MSPQNAPEWAQGTEPAKSKKTPDSTTLKHMAESIGGLALVTAVLTSSGKANATEAFQDPVQDNLGLSGMTFVTQVDESGPNTRLLAVNNASGKLQPYVIGTSDGVKWDSPPPTPITGAGAPGHTIGEFVTCKDGNAYRTFDGLAQYSPWNGNEATGPWVEVPNINGGTVIAIKCDPTGKILYVATDTWSFPNTRVTKGTIGKWDDWTPLDKCADPNSAGGILSIDFSLAGDAMYITNNDTQFSDPKAFAVPWNGSDCTGPLVNLNNVPNSSPKINIPGVGTETFKIAPSGRAWISRTDGVFHADKVVGQGGADAGAPDGGVDAGQDAGAPDSGADAGGDAGAQDGGVDGGSQDAGVGGAGGAAPDAGQGGQGGADAGVGGNSQDAGGNGQGGTGGFNAGGHGLGGGLNTGGHAGQGGMGTGGSPEGGNGPGGSPAGGQGQGAGGEGLGGSGGSTTTNPGECFAEASPANQEKDLDNPACNADSTSFHGQIDLKNGPVTMTWTRGGLEQSITCKPGASNNGEIFIKLDANDTPVKTTNGISCGIKEDPKITQKVKYESAIPGQQHGVFLGLEDTEAFNDFSRFSVPDKGIWIADVKMTTGRAHMYKPDGISPINIMTKDGQSLGNGLDAANAATKEALVDYSNFTASTPDQTAKQPDQQPPPPPEDKGGCEIANPVDAHTNAFGSALLLAAGVLLARRRQQAAARQ